MLLEGRRRHSTVGNICVRAINFASDAFNAAKEKKERKKEVHTWDKRVSENLHAHEKERIPPGKLIVCYSPYWNRLVRGNHKVFR